MNYAVHSPPQCVCRASAARLPNAADLVSVAEITPMRRPLVGRYAADYAPTLSVHCTMECAIGRASRAMALPDFKVVGPAIHLALPNLFLKLSTYLNIFSNIFIFF